MKISDVVYKNLEIITGLSEAELRDMPELDLKKEELVDSLSIAELMTAIGAELGKKIDLKRFAAEDFSSITRLINAVERQCA